MIGWTKASLTKFRCSTEVDNLIDACIDRKKLEGNYTMIHFFFQTKQHSNYDGGFFFKISRDSPYRTNLRMKSLLGFGITHNLV